MRTPVHVAGRSEQELINAEDLSLQEYLNRHHETLNFTMTCAGGALVSQNKANSVGSAERTERKSCSSCALRNEANSRGKRFAQSPQRKTLGSRHFTKQSQFRGHPAQNLRRDR